MYVKQIMENTIDNNPAQAKREGWDIYDCFGSDSGPSQIQKNDDDTKFKTDLEAIKFVAKRATLANSNYHKQAILKVIEANPQEAVIILKSLLDDSIPYVH